MTVHGEAGGRTQPWRIGRPQPAVRALADRGALTGRFLDVGCGTGEHALLAASRGADVTGVDLDGTALDLARRRARELGLSVTFVLGDVSVVPASTLGLFDTLLESLVLHAIPAGRRAAHGRVLARLSAPGGRLHVLGYAAAQADVPHHLEPGDVESALAPRWRLDDSVPVTVDTRVHPDGARGWLLSLTRTSDEP